MTASHPLLHPASCSPPQSARSSSRFHCRPPRRSTHAPSSHHPSPPLQVSISITGPQPSQNNLTRPPSHTLLNIPTHLVSLEPHYAPTSHASFISSAFHPCLPLGPPSWTLAHHHGKCPRTRRNRPHPPHTPFYSHASSAPLLVSHADPRPTKPDLHPKHLPLLTELPPPRPSDQALCISARLFQVPQICLSEPASNIPS